MDSSGPRQRPRGSRWSRCWCREDLTTCYQGQIYGYSETASAHCTCSHRLRWSVTVDLRRYVSSAVDSQSDCRIHEPVVNPGVRMALLSQLGSRAAFSKCHEQSYAGLQTKTRESAPTHSRTTCSRSMERHSSLAIRSSELAVTRSADRKL